MRRFMLILVFLAVGTPTPAIRAADKKRFYSEDSFWNTPIPDSPSIDPNSDNLLKTAILPYQSRANFTNSPIWGISVIEAGPEARSYEVRCRKYGCGNSVSFPIPKGALPDTGSDHHLVVLRGNHELDFWEASYDPRNDTWSAGSRYLIDLDGWGACGRPGTHCNSGVAAGFAEMGGVVRPEEIREGHIDHALSITMVYTRRRYIACPATHTDGKYDDPNAMPEGARLQLDPSFDVDAQPWPRWQKIIARALQKYGAYVSDTGGTIAIYGQSDINDGNLKWKSLGVPDNSPSVANFPWDRVRVLKLEPCN